MKCSQRKKSVLHSRLFASESKFKLDSSFRNVKDIETNCIWILYGHDIGYLHDIGSQFGTPDIGIFPILGTTYPIWDILDVPNLPKIRWFPITDLMVPDIDPDIGCDPISGHQDTISVIKYPILGSISDSISGIPISACTEYRYWVQNRVQCRVSSRFLSFDLLELTFSSNQSIYTSVSL
jgi:hypothetical protein